MAKIKINLPNESFNFEIEGNEPTEEEQAAINQIVQQKLAESKKAEEVAAQTTEPSPEKNKQLFDVETGIKNNALRAALGVAETKEEEEAILRKFDLSDDDFTRDNRGRLALTPTGASKFGQETDKNILIDEEGFSRYDFSDLSGIAPELITGIGGAIAGQLLIPIPVLGAAIGAGVGAGSGQAIEEGVEALAGVSKQSGEEIAKDIGREFAYGFVGEGLLGGAVAAFRLVRRGVTPGKGLTSKEATTAGQSISEPIDEAGNIIKPKDFAKLSADEQIAATSRVVTKPDGTVVRGGFGVRPTLSAIKAPSLVARIQAIGEKIFKTSDRLKNNNDQIKTLLDAYKQKYGVTDDVIDADVGQILKDGMVENNTKLLNVEEQLSSAVVKHLEDSVNAFKQAGVRNSNVESDLFEIIRDASINFDEMISGKFAAVDKVLRNSSLGGDAFITTGRFKDTIKRLKRDYGSSIAAGTKDGKSISQIIAAVENVGGAAFNKKASFNQIYNLRKTLSDIRMELPPTSKTVRGELVTKDGDGLLDQVDKIFKEMGDENSATFREIIARESLSPADAQKFKNAGKAIKKAQTKFFLGRKLIEDLNASKTIKNLEKYKRQPGDIVDEIPQNIDIYENVVKNNNPEFIQQARKFITEYGGGAQLADEFVARAANHTLEESLKKSGISNFTNVKNFNSEKFAQSIKNLGTTAKELFGAETDQILKLADEIGSVKITGLESPQVLRQFRNIKGDTTSNATLVRKLEALATTQKRLAANQKNVVLRKLADDTGDLDPVEAARFLVQKTTKNSQIKPVIEYFKKQGQNGEQALNKIRSYYINSIIDDFGESIMTDGKSLNAFADRLLAASKDNKLVTVFGKEVGNNMKKFGQILKFNARTAEGGDLVAANIAASPFQNVGKLVKFSILGNRLLSNGYYDDILKQYNGVVLDQFKKPAERAREYGSIIGKALSIGIGQTMQETIDNAESQAQAFLESQGLNVKLPDIKAEDLKTGNLSTFLQPTRPNVPLSQLKIPEPVSGTTLGNIDVTNPANAFSLGLNPTDIAIAQRRRGTQ